jgi:membrane-associated protease RseP (regulator of RpoE activity)
MSPAFGWATIVLVVVVASIFMLRDLHQTSNMDVLWAILLVLTVLVHEFGHAFQAKLKGHNVKEPAVLFLSIKVKNCLAAFMIWMALQAVLTMLIEFGVTVVYAFQHASQPLGTILLIGSKMALGNIFTPPFSPLLYLAAAVLIFKWHPTAKVLNFVVKIPLGVGMHVTHTYRDWSDIAAGVTCESVVWLVLGLGINPLFLWMVPMTLAINLIIPLKIKGEGNDAVCLWREQFARRKGFTGVTEV